MIPIKLIKAAVLFIALLSIVFALLYKLTPEDAWNFLQNIYAVVTIYLMSQMKLVLR